MSDVLPDWQHPDDAVLAPIHEGPTAFERWQTAQAEIAAREGEGRHPDNYCEICDQDFVDHAMVGYFVCPDDDTVRFVHRACGKSARWLDAPAHRLSEYNPELGTAGGD